MAVARIFPDTQQGKERTSVLNTEVSSAYVIHARYVLRDAPDLADAVTAGTVALNAAYEETRQRNKSGRGCVGTKGLVRIR